MRPDQNPSADANIALIYVGLDDRDQAIIWLNRAYEARFTRPSCCGRLSILCGPTPNSKISGAESASRLES